MELRDGFAAQGKVQPASRTSSGVCWETGQEVVVEAALPRDHGSGVLASKQQLNASRRSKH